MIKAVIFDLDGTILDTITDLNEAINYALVNVNEAKVSIDETKSYLGNGIKALVNKALKGNSDKLEEAYQLFQTYYETNANCHTKPYPYIKELLNNLASKEIRLFVLSNKQESFLKPLVKAHFNNLFEMVIGDKEGFSRKPDPKGLLDLINKARLTKEEVIYIGDSEVDVETTKRAGVLGLFVSYGFRKKEELEKLTPNVYDSALKLEEAINQYL